MPPSILTGGYLVLYWLLLGQGEVIKASIFPGGAIRPLETKLASDGTTRCNYVIRKRLEQLVLQLAPEQQKIEASLD